MTMSPVHASARLVFPLALAAVTALAGCATSDPKRPTEPKAAAATKPVQSIANFSSALRCMDTLLLDYGVRDITVIVEDLADQTKGAAGAGTKDLLISVVSDMTQRSRAIRIVASGKDWGNTVNAMVALKREQFAVAPQYALRGSITLTDQNVQRNGETTAAAVLGVDLSMLTTHDMSVVPGSTARNAAVLFKQGRGYDGKAEIRKFGVNFGLQSNGSEVVGPASRAVVEIAAMELFGRLTRVPYWTCLGMTEAHEGVSAEMQDWFDTMAAQPVEIIKYFQTQLRLRRAYDGPIDGTVSAQFKDAVARYREALGQPREPKLSLEFFKAYLAADHRQVEAKLTPSTVAPTQVAAVPTPVAPVAPTAAPTPLQVNVVGQAPAKAQQLALRIGTLNDTRRFGRGEAVQLTIRPSRDAHVYCFLQDENKKIIRFFPNRFQNDSRVQQAGGLQLPGAMRFEITMNGSGKQETVSCFATDRDVLAQLPAGVNAGDFDPLPVASLDQIRTAFAKVANGALAHDTFQIQPK